jgi:transposase, IS5 family
VSPARWRVGEHWHFGMKSHIGVDVESDLVHGMIATPANAGGVTQTLHVIHGGEADGFGDSGYTAAHKREESRPGTMAVSPPT